jgi:addiction module HigA family antidote
MSRSRAVGHQLQRPTGSEIASKTGPTVMLRVTRISVTSATRIRSFTLSSARVVWKRFASPYANNTRRGGFVRKNRCTIAAGRETRMARKLQPLHPGEILLEDFLKPLGVSQYRFAKGLSVPPRRINEIVPGKRAISADTALRRRTVLRHLRPLLAQSPGQLRSGWSSATVWLAGSPKKSRCSERQADCVHRAAGPLLASWRLTWVVRLPRPSRGGVPK